MHTNRQSAWRPLPPARRAFFQWLLAAVAVIAIAGCGGGGQGTGAPLAAGRAEAVINIKWPQASTSGRLIPEAAKSILVVVINPLTSVRLKEVTIPRPPAGQNTTSTKIEDLPTTTIHFVATAFPTTDASGVPQATGTRDATLVKSVVTPVDLTMGTTITHVRVNDRRTREVFADAGRAGGASRDEPLPISLAPDASVPLSAEALDADNATVLVNPKKWKWDVGSTNVCTVAPTDDTATLKGGTAGNATLTVTESETGKNIQVSIVVADTGLWNQQYGNAQNTNSSAGPASGGIASRVPLGDTVQVVGTGIAPDSAALEDSTGAIQFALLLPPGLDAWYSLHGSALSRLFDQSPSVSAVGPDGTLYGNGWQVNKTAVYALTPAGAPKWSVPIQNPQFGLTLTPDGILYASDGTGTKLLSIDAATGGVRWTVATPVLAKPAVAPNGTIFVCSRDSSGAARVAALNPATGAVLWSTPLDQKDGGAQQIAVTQTGAVVVQASAGVSAFDPTSGSLRWHVKAYNNVGQQMVVTKTGTVVTTMLNQFGGNGGIQGLDAETGSVRWQLPDFNGQIWPFGAAADGTVYIARTTDNGSKQIVLALDGVSGGQKWSYVPHYMFPAYGIVLVGKDGAVYAIDHDGTFGTSDFHTVMVILR